MSNLVELFDNVVEFQNYNGVPLAAGKLYVFALGRTRLMDTWSDIDGESLNPNPIILDDLGQCHCYCSDDFDYTLVVCDQFDNEIFSVDKYLLSKGEHSHADVAVAPSEHIGVSSYHVGEVTVYVPYLTGEVGKIYEGIEPIVVNNDVNRISANHIPLGVQDPLYFVEDSETACILGCSAQTEIPAELSGKWDEASDAVIANSAQWAEGTEYEAGSYIDITNNTISVVNLPTSADVQNIVDVATSGLMPSGDYLTKESADTLYQPTGNYLTGLPEDLVYSADITGLATTAQLDEKLDKTDSGNFYPMEGNPSGFLTAHQSLQGYATEQWVEDKGYITGVNIPESATWNATTQTVSANSAQWGATNPQIPVTGINGIKISESGDTVVFEVSADYALADDLTSKLDTTAFSDVSGTFLTAHQDLSDYQTTAGMTAYQEAGDYYSASNPSGFITGVDLSDYATTAELADKQDITGMTAYQPVGNYQTAGDYLTTADSANFYTTANESGFITGVDLTPYQLTADMTAYQPAGDYLTTADSANFYTTANESGFISEVPAGTMNESAFEYNGSNKISAYNGSAFAGGGGADLDFGYDESGAISSINTSALSDSRAGTPLYVESPLFTGQSGDSAYIGVSGYVWQSALLFHTDTPVTQTTYTLSENCSNYDKLEVDFYDINNWRTVMECSIPSNLDASGTRGGYFSVVPASTATGAAVWFKAFNWTAANTTWTCYCSEIAAQGGSTTQTVNANQPENPPKVVNIIGWKRVGV